MSDPFDDFDEVGWLDLLEGGHPAFNTVSDEEVFDQSRWSTVYSQVFKQRDLGTFWRVYHERGNTECQETELNCSWEQVEPYTVVVTKYKRIA